MRSTPFAVALAGGLLAAAMSLALPAPAAHADIVAPMPTRRQPRLRLRSIRVVSSDAPAADSNALRADVSAALHAASGRLRRCARDSDLRRDPLRTRSRTFTGRLTFTRSARGTLVRRSSTLPAAAAACIERAARGIRGGSTPRGTVVIEFSYTLS